MSFIKRHQREIQRFEGNPQVRLRVSLSVFRRPYLQRENPGARLLRKLGTRAQPGQRRVCRRLHLLSRDSPAAALHAWALPSQQHPLLQLARWSSDAVGKIMTTRVHYYLLVPHKITALPQHGSSTSFPMNFGLIMMIMVREYGNQSPRC